MQIKDFEILLGLKEILEGHKIFTGEDFTVYNALDRVFNEDHWITVHPHGKDEKGQPLLVKDGETNKDAIDRKYGKEKKLAIKNNDKKIKQLKEKLKELESKPYTDISEWKKQVIESRAIKKEIGNLEAIDKAKEKGGYTEKLQNLANFSQFSDISSFPEELQEHIYKGFKKIYDKYPQIKCEGLSIIKLGGEDSAFAQMGEISNILDLNSFYYNDFEKLKEEYNETVRIGYHPKGTDYNSIIAHELGHSLQHYIEQKYDIPPRKIKSQVLKATGYKVKDVLDNLSIYADEDTKEFFAEAFAEYMTSSNPRPIAKEFGKIIDNILKTNI